MDVYRLHLNGLIQSIESVKSFTGCSWGDAVNSIVLLIERNKTYPHKKQKVYDDLNEHFLPLIREFDK